MKKYKEIKVKDVKVGNNYYFNEGTIINVFKKVKAVSERISPSGEKIVMFFCPYFVKKDGKAKYQELAGSTIIFV